MDRGDIFLFLCRGIHCLFIVSASKSGLGWYYGYISLRFMKTLLSAHMHACEVYWWYLVSRKRQLCVAWLDHGLSLCENRKLKGFSRLLQTKLRKWGVITDTCLVFISYLVEYHTCIFAGLCTSWLLVLTHSLLVPKTTRLTRIRLGMVKPGIKPGHSWCHKIVATLRCYAMSHFAMGRHELPSGMGGAALQPGRTCPWPGPNSGTIPSRPGTDFHMLTISYAFK